MQDSALRIKVLVLDKRHATERDVFEVRKALATRSEYDPRSIFPTFFPPPSAEEIERGIEELLSGEVPTEMESTVSPEEAMSLLEMMKFDSGSLGPDDLRMFDGNASNSPGTEDAG